MRTATFVVAAALAGAAALPAVFTTQAQSGTAAAPGFKFDKRYGIVKAGNNDCQTEPSSCAGTSKRDGGSRRVASHYRYRASSRHVE